MLTKLTTRNVRSLEDVEVPLGPLSAFVGPNGSGETAVLHAGDLHVDLDPLEGMDLADVSAPLISATKAVLPPAI